MVRIDTWPYEVDEEFRGKGTAFATVTATVAYVYQKDETKAPSYKFKEDDTEENGYKGRLWGDSAEWDDEADAFKPFKGKVYQVGDVVDLKLRQSVKNGRHYYNIYRIRLSQSKTPTDTTRMHPDGSYADKELPAASPQAVAQIPPLEQRILLGMAFNNLTVILKGFWEVKDEVDSDALADMFSDKTGLQAYAQWLKWFNEASRGLPLSPVVDEEPQVMADANEIAEQANAHLSEDGDTVLPW